jgi:hypothetical protein
MIGRIESLAGWQFTGLGIAMLLVSLAIVPPDALAQAGVCCGCNATCSASAGGTSCGQCLATYCDGDPLMTSQCCQSYCGSDAKCLANCSAASRSGQCPDDPVKICKSPGSPCRLPSAPGVCKPSTNKSQCECAP